MAASGFESSVLTFTGLADAKTWTHKLRGMSWLHVPGYYHKNAALTHPGVVHEKASFNYARLVVTSVYSTVANR
jgi:hypothetical protein